MGGCVVNVLIRCVYMCQRVCLHASDSVLNVLGIFACIGR